MNPHDELDSLIELLPNEKPLMLQAEHIPAALTPQPYRRMLVHDAHMTVTMEAYHNAPIEVKVLQENADGDHYCRQSVLMKTANGSVTQFGIVRFDFRYVTEAVRKEILAGAVPLGRVLIAHNILRHVDLGAVLRITIGPRLAEIFGCDVGQVTYGRLATLFCNRQPAVDLLEISAPLAMESSREKKRSHEEVPARHN